MSPELVSALLMGGLLVLLALGVEIGVAMGVAACAGLVCAVDKPIVQMAWTAWESLNSFTLLAMPLFIFMGAVFSGSGAVNLLFGALDKWLGWLPGGLASVVVAANGVFGAISGSSVAAAATFSMIAYPEMEKRGYDPKLSIGAIAVGGTLSVLVPPSLILIVYGSWENVTVARLFAAALIPGMVLMLLLMATVIAMVKLRPELAPRSQPASWAERVKAIKDMIPWLVVIVVVMGSIFGGLMTPTEASALGAIMALGIAWYYDTLTYAMVRNSLLSAVKVSAMIAFIIFAARLLSFVLQDLGATAKVSSAVLDMGFGKYWTMLAIVILYLNPGHVLRLDGHDAAHAVVRHAGDHEAGLRPGVVGRHVRAAGRDRARDAALRAEPFHDPRRPTQVLRDVHRTVVPALPRGDDPDGLDPHLLPRTGDVAAAAPLLR